MKKTGIWIDEKRAYIITFEDGEVFMKTVLSDIDNDSKPLEKIKVLEKTGPLEILKDRKVLEIKKHFLKNYFKTVTPHLKESSSIVIFGPAEIPQEFGEELQNNFSDIHKKVIEIIKADSMTENQMQAMVREYYKL